MKKPTNHKRGNERPTMAAYKLLYGRIDKTARTDTGTPPRTPDPPLKPE